MQEDGEYHRPSIGENGVDGQKHRVHNYIKNIMLLKTVSYTKWKRSPVIGAAIQIIDEHTSIIC